MSRRTGKFLPKQIQDMHEELFRRGAKARGRAATHYDKTVREVEFDEGERVFLFHPPGLVEQGRKLRSPWLGPYRVVEKLSPISYVLRGEVSGETARVHVNRIRRFSEEIKEKGSPQSGVYPDSRRLALRIVDSNVENGVRLMKVISVGRNGYVWTKATEISEIAVRFYDLSKEDQELRWRGSRVEYQ